MLPTAQVCALAADRGSGSWTAHEVSRAEHVRPLVGRTHFPIISAGPIHPRVAEVASERSGEMLDGSPRVTYRESARTIALLRAAAHRLSARASCHAPQARPLTPPPRNGRQRPGGGRGRSVPNWPWSRHAPRPRHSRWQRSNSLFCRRPTIVLGDGGLALRVCADLRHPLVIPGRATGTVQGTASKPRAPAPTSVPYRPDRTAAAAPRPSPRPSVAPVSSLLQSLSRCPSLMQVAVNDEVRRPARLSRDRRLGRRWLSPVCAARRSSPIASRSFQLPRSRRPARDRPCAQKRAQGLIAAANWRCLQPWQCRLASRCWVEFVPACPYNL